ncbi:hypothetical protein N9L52_01560 [Litoricolaceae bacterium]|nr:hypothetical protein [Litorivicinaceae bacterium]
MTDRYTKTVLTVIAGCLLVLTVEKIPVVDSAEAATLGAITNRISEVIESCVGTQRGERITFDCNWR